MVDLFDLVNSFIEKGGGDVVDREIGRFDSDLNSGNDDDDDDMEEMKDSLKRLFEFDNGDEARRKATVEIQKAWPRVSKDSSSPPSPEFKRRLMAQLREQGLDAGICKSKWEKNGTLPSGDFEYIDANINETWYVINISLAAEFEIARPTKNYLSLLAIFPQVSICKAEEMKKIVKIMCTAIKRSMNDMRMPVPPWRQHGYVHVKWFGSYKRTTTEFPAKSVMDRNRTIGFVSFLGRSCHRSQSEDYRGGKFCSKVGNLALAMNGAS